MTLRGLWALLINLDVNIRIEKCSLKHKVSMAQLLCVHFPRRVLQDLTPLDTLGVFSTKYNFP